MEVTEKTNLYRASYEERDCEGWSSISPKFNILANSEIEALEKASIAFNNLKEIEKSKQIKFGKGHRRDYNQYEFRSITLETGRLIY